MKWANDFFTVFGDNTGLCKNTLSVHLYLYRFNNLFKTLIAISNMSRVMNVRNVMVHMNDINPVKLDIRVYTFFCAHSLDSIIRK